jgi:HAE1 family hydrophobic/amphiphilic exporter-1
MNLSEIFIRRPVMTTLVMMTLLIFGIMAYRLLPVSNLPNVDFPTIQVSASLPGASPETMAASVATTLERQFSTIAGLDTMTSVSSMGSSQVTLQFTLDRDIDAAAQDVQAAIARVQRSLPRDMPSPPSYSKVNPADSPILFIALTSPTLPLSTLTEYGNNFIAQRLSTVSGVAQVMVYGSQKYAVRVQLDPRALTTRGIGIDEVVGAIQGANVNLPTGILHGPERAFTVQADGQLTRAEGYNDAIVAWRDGMPVRLRDLGAALDGVENNKTAAWFNTPERAQRAMNLAIQKQPGANTVAVARAIKELLPSLRAQLPASVTLSVLLDRSESIEESVADVQFTLLLTLCLVVLVIFLFLRNLSATLIPSLSMPLSILGTFIAMYLMDFSLDNLSLMALTLSVGFVVDDAIVMLENIVRHAEMGRSPFEAALTGSREIGFTIVSMTLSLTAVFIPVLFMGGIVGRLFNEFAVTIGVAVLVSGFVSLSLTPMMAGRFMRPPQEVHHGRVYAASERVFDAGLRLYRATLTRVLDHRLASMTVLLASLILTAVLFRVVPKGFIPSEDIGQLFGQTEGLEGTSFAGMAERQQAVAEILRRDPNVEAFMSSAGARGSSGQMNSGNLFIRLKPRGERALTADEVVQELRRKAAAVPGIRAYIQNPPPINIGGRFSKGLYQYTLQSPDTRVLYEAAPRLEARLRDLPILQDVTSDLQIKNPQVNLRIDRDRAAALGVSAQLIEEALYSAYGSRQVSQIYAPTDQYAVILEMKPEFQDAPETLSLLHVRSKRGDLVPLESLAALEQGVGPLSVSHSGQLPSVTLSFNLKPGVSLGEAVDRVDAVAKATLPDTIATGFQGTAQAFQLSMKGLGLLLLMAILVIYIVLGILYESFIHPLTILSALPLAGFGALLTLWIFSVELSIYAFIGIIMLVGLVKKNGIMMIDFALEAQRREGKGPRDAIFEACLIRFRPIMMTTMAALMGTLPIALGFGAGAEARRPLGLAVVGGLLFSQMLTLYVTPVFFLTMDQFQRWLRRRFGGKTA